MKTVELALETLRGLATVGNSNRTPLGSQNSRTLTPVKNAVRPVVQSPRSAAHPTGKRPIATRAPLGSAVAKLKQTRRGVYTVTGFTYCERNGEAPQPLVAIQGIGAGEHLGAWQLHRGKPRGSVTLLHTAADLETLRTDIARGRVRGCTRGSGGRTGRANGGEKPAPRTP